MNFIKNYWLSITAFIFINAMLSIASLIITQILGFDLQIQNGMSEDEEFFAYSIIGLIEIFILLLASIINDDYNRFKKSI